MLTAPNINTLSTNTRNFLSFQKNAREIPLEFMSYYFSFDPWYDADSYNQRDMFTKRVECNYDIFDAHANGTGKTSATVAAALTLYIGQWPDIILPIFAPSEDSVKRTFWAQAHQMLSKCNIKVKGKLYEWLGSPDVLKWNHPKVPWSYIQGYSPKTGGTGQGRKGQKVVIVVEEATDTPDPTWTAIDGLRMQGDSVMFVNANPLTRDCKAYVSLWDNPLIECHSLSAMAHPNVKYKLQPNDEGFIKGAVTIDDIERLKQKCIKESNDGEYERHPDWQARVLGRWPSEEAALVVIPYEWIDKVRKLNLPAGEPKRAGLDIAGQGRDYTALWCQHGKRVVGLYRWYHKDGIQVAKLVKEELDKHGIREFVYDEGFEATTGKILEEWGYSAIPFRFNRKPYDDTYQYAVDEAAFNMRDKFRQEEICFGEEVDSDLIHVFAEECQRYFHRSIGGEGKLRLESKDQFKKRTGRNSPDVFDAGLMCCGRELREITSGVEFMEW